MIEKSFFLIRTNPALTGNVKLVVSSDYKLYLESFAINKALSQDRFKHFELKKDEYYKEVIPHFFKDIENNDIFEVKFSNDTDITYNDYRFQFDDQYYSGAYHTEDVWHKEEYEYMAPLYIKNNKLPQKFIILRVDGAGSLNEDSKSSNFRKNIIDNWKFVSEFDLSNSDLGVFLKRNLIDDDAYPKHPLIIKHGEVDLSEINGIDLKVGGFVTKYSNLHDTQAKNTPIFRSEEFITKLWENNNILYPHIINMKFLFDDTPATSNTLRNYSINRYVGFYVDEAPIIKKISPYEGIELNKTPFNTLQNLTEIEISEIPHIKDNKFVREINGRLYSFDPIKKGWDDNETFWVEWEGEFYRIEKKINTDKDFFKQDSIIGDFIYQIVCNKTIECDLSINFEGNVATIDRKINGNILETFVTSAPNNILDNQILKQMKKVLINELSTLKDKIKIGNSVFKNTVIKNHIENISTQYINLIRDYKWYTVNNESKFLFRIDVNIMDNEFNIPNFDEADLHLIKIENEHHVIKRYPLNTPNVGGKYYLHTDWQVVVDDKDISSWINNGQLNKNPQFYNNKNIKTISTDNVPPFFEITRVSFTDIQDFDFDRIETDYTNYEYEKKYELTPSNHIEPKLFAKEYRDITLTVRSIPNDKVRRIPILDINNRAYNVRDQIGEINTFTNLPYQDTDLYRKEYDETWSLYDGIVDDVRWYGFKERNISLKRKFYREENYIWRDEENNKTYEMDFKSNSDPKSIIQDIDWGVDNKNEIGILKTLFKPKAKLDPNKQFDPNYIPVSSEYITSDELWEIRNGNLTDIWKKNQSICKWGLYNSIGLHDYPYRLNYSLDVAGVYNREPNSFSGQEYPLRSHFDLEYFYRFGIDNPTDYTFYSLHLKNTSFNDNTGFNIDKYISNEFNYFEYLLKSDQETSEGLVLTEKYSSFISESEFSDSYTVFRGIKYIISDVEEIKTEIDPDDSSNIIIDEIVTKPNSKYEDYKFSIIFGRKLSSFEFNAGSGNSNSGCDIYVNDIWKNIIIHLYVDSDEIIQLTDDSNALINAETCPIDLWYSDNISKREISPEVWDNSEFKLNGFGIGIRPRDFMLSNFTFILNNYNYLPSSNNDELRFIHIYNDGREPKIMSYQDTDFIIKSELPDEILTKEKSFITEPIQVPTNLFDINNTLKNRIITDDDINNPNGNSDFTIDGYRVDSLIDINAYNDYPIAKEIKESSDIREYWELDDETDPSMFRYSGVYAPIFRKIPLFRPLGYLSLSKNSLTPILSNGNWKFYDPSSELSSPNLYNFGTLKEMIFSKINTTTNILKIQDPNDKERSIYPMVDEYGYDFDSRYIFASNWEPSFNYLSRRVEIEKNEYPDIAGYTILFDGNKDFLRIPDADKFNLERYFIENINYENYINYEPEGERSFFRKSFLGLERHLLDGNNNFEDLSEVKTHEMKLLANQDYKISLDLLNRVGSQYEALDYWIEVIPDPTDNNQISTSTKKLILSGTTEVNVGHLEIIFSTNKYIESLITVNEPPTIDSTISVGVLNLPKEYVYGNTINIRINFRLRTTEAQTAYLDVFMKLQMSSALDNFLDIDTYGTNGVGVIQYQNNTGVWGGYLRKDGDNPELGDVYNYPFRIKGLNNYSNITTLKNNLISFQDTNPKIFSNLGARGFTITDNIENRNNKIIRISHTEPFSFEPERWTDIQDGKSIVYVSQNYGDSSVYPAHTLRWFTTYKKETNQILTAPIHKFETEQNKVSLLPKSIKKKQSFIPGKLTLPKFILPTFKPQPIESTIEQIKKGVNTNTVKSVENFNNAPKGAFGLTLPKFIQPIGKFTFKPSNIFQPIPLPKPPIMTSNVVQKIVGVENVVKETIEFQIIPDNGSTISVVVNVRHPEDGSPLPITDIIGLINNIITPYNYIASDDTIDLYQPFKDLKIKSKHSGSYFNFIIQEMSSHIEIIKDKSIYAKEEVSTSEIFTKTSLKEGSKRITGYLSDYTVEFWIKVSSFNKEYETIFYKGVEDTTSDVWVDDDFHNFTLIIGRNKTSDQLAFRTCHKKFNGNFENHTLISNAVITDNNWHHVAFVVDTLKRKKSIYIDGHLDSKVEDFLTPSYESSTSQQELISLFLDNRKRFMPKSEDTFLFPDFGSLASKIRNNSQDNKTLYWYDVIRGYKELTYWDKQTQLKKLGITIDEAFREYQENFENLDYYLNTSIDNSWNILIATDSTLSLGKRTFGGAIDELRIWNYARSSEQISSNKNFILRPESYLDPLKSLVAYYRFDEGKGINTLIDLMGGKMISDIVRWCKAKTSFINDGDAEREKDELTYYQFETDFYPAANIEINLDEIEFIVSGADIIGFSDERYVAMSPPPSIKNSLNAIEKPIFTKSEFILAKKVKPNIDIQSKLNSTKVLTSNLPKKKDFLMNTLIKNSGNSAQKLLSDLIKPLVQPKKIIETIAKAPAKIISGIKKLFGKKKK